MPVVRAALVTRVRVLIAACTLLACGEPRESPAPPPPPAPAPAPPPAVVLPPPPPPPFAWRVGPPERASILLGVPTFPVTRQDALPEPWGERYYEPATRVALTASTEAAAAYVARHGPGSARRDLRVLLGEELFARYLERGTAAMGGEPDASAIATLDPVGATMVLGLAELGYRLPDDGLVARLRSWAGATGRPIVALLDDATALEEIDAVSDADALGALRENLSEPTRFSRWLEASRAAWAQGDLAAMVLACDEPERTERWDDASRRAFREHARTLVEPTAAALAETPTVVAIHVCTLVVDGGLLALLRERGVEPIRLGEDEGE